MLCSLWPPGGVPGQAKEGSDRWRPRVVPCALQPAQPAAQGEVEREGKMIKKNVMLTKWSYIGSVPNCPTAR